MYKLYKLKYLVNKLGTSLWGGDACGSAWSPLVTERVRGRRRETAYE